MSKETSVRLSFLDGCPGPIGDRSAQTKMACPKAHPGRQVHSLKVVIPIHAIKSSLISSSIS
jgi:hypothetical protein